MTLLVQFERCLEKSAECPSGVDILEACLELAEMLLEKNKAYGNSALEPLRIFAKDLPADAGIRLRMDDKISRIMRGSDAGEDPVWDLAGYIILQRIFDKRVK